MIRYLLHKLMVRLAASRFTLLANMADKVITYGASEGFGAITGWNAKKTTDPTAYERLTGHDDKGDEVASKLVGEKNEVSSDYECESDTNTIPADIGALVNSLILTEISLSTSKGPATMSLGGHNHGANAHAASPALRVATHGMTITSAFGAKDFLGGTAATDSAVVSGTCTIRCDHNDQDDGEGDHLVGENCNAVIECVTTWSGVPTTAAEAGWDVTVESTEDESTGFIKTVVTGIKKLAMA
jgi:hypothetical protein